MKSNRFQKARERRAIERVGTDEDLSRLWETNTSSEEGLGAILRLKDQTTLAHIAQREPDDSLRAEAVKRLEDKELLRRIALTDKSAFVRLIAQKHYEYSGEESWVSDEPDEEAERMILDYLLANSSPDMKDGK